MTGHNEVVLVVYDPKQVSYDELLREFEQLRYRLGLDEGGDGDLYSWSQG